MINSEPSTLNPGYITKLKKHTHQQQPQPNKQKPVLDHSFLYQKSTEMLRTYYSVSPKYVDFVQQQGTVP